MSDVNIVVWTTSEAEDYTDDENHIDFVSGPVPQQGDLVTFNGVKCVVHAVEWDIQPRTETMLVNRCWAIVRLRRIPPKE